MKRDFSDLMIAGGRKEHHLTWLMEEKGESVLFLAGIMSQVPSLSYCQLLWFGSTVSNLTSHNCQL